MISVYLSIDANMLISNNCVSEIAVSICMCDKPLEILLERVIYILITIKVSKIQKSPRRHFAKRI